MVDIAQLVSASDCGSEGRGFESHYPPHKNKTHPFGWVLFLSRDEGFEKSNATIQDLQRMFCSDFYRKIRKAKIERVYGSLEPQISSMGDSHDPQIPYKNRRYPKISPVFMGWMMGVEPTTFRATI